MSNREHLLDKKQGNQVYNLYLTFSSSILLENKASVARDHLANERTFLAWLRTSFSLITVGVAVTQLHRITPENLILHAKMGKAIGAAFVMFSIVFLYFANARYFHAQMAMTKGRFPASRGVVLFGSACICVLLITMFVIILMES